MTNVITISPTAERSVRKTIRLILLGAIIMFLILQFGVTILASVMDFTWGALIATAVMLTFALALEYFTFARRPTEALRALGWGRASSSALLVAMILTLLMLTFFPVVSLIWGISLELREDWLWILLGAIILNGIGEETLFRGFIFGHLRHAGLSFARAGLISLFIFAAVHLLLFVQNPFVVAFAATLIALVASFPLALLFERAGFSIWPTAILHVATHAIRLLLIPEPYTMPVLVAWLGLQIFMPLLILPFRGFLRKSNRSSKGIRPKGYTDEFSKFTD
jgi:membrane protease YdiL (CAAX protease family)